MQQSERIEREQGGNPGTNLLGGYPDLNHFALPSSHRAKVKDMGNDLEYRRRVTKERTARGETEEISSSLTLSHSAKWLAFIVLIVLLGAGLSSFGAFRAALKWLGLA